MNRRQSLTLMLGGVGAACCRVSWAASPESKLMSGVSQLIQAQVDAGPLESAVVSVRHGDTTFQHAFGKAGSINAPFLIASITKPMTAACVMVLADRGELKLSDRAVKFIPEFSEGARKEITIEQLLTHTSGLPDQLANNNELRQRHAPLSEFVKGAITTPLLFAPGTKYQYQSMGILLAAEIVERLTKQRLADFMAANVFKPLGMTRSALGLGTFKMTDVVRCQTERAAPEAGAGAASAKEWDWNSAYWRNLAAPWGGAHCSAGDVAKFLTRFTQPNGKVLRQETAKLMIRNHTENLGARRGIGFVLGPDSFGKGCSARSFGHGGSTGTLAWADPERKTVCVILTSLPASVSSALVLKPVSDLVAG